MNTSDQSAKKPQIKTYFVEIQRSNSNFLMVTALNIDDAKSIALKQSEDPTWQFDHITEVFNIQETPVHGFLICILDALIRIKKAGKLAPIIREG